MAERVVDEKMTSPEPAPPRRRAALRWMVRSFLSLWAVAGGWVVFSFLKPPRTGGRGPRTVSGGPLAGLPVGAARLVRHGSQPLFVVRVSERETVAVSAVCTHRQCVLEWSEQRKVFVCPCHAGVFDSTGNVVSGLPRRALAQYRTSLRREEVVIHLD